MSKSILFGSNGPKWPSFRPINDTVRGGASTSSFTVDSSSGIASFEGNLDITALGGAGFASQCTTFGPPLAFSRATTSGLAITFLSSPSLARSPSVSPSPSQFTSATPTSFVLALKSTIPDDRPDGRRESVMSYEFTWNAATSSHASLLSSSPVINAEKLSEKGGATQEHTTIEAKWEDFIPMFRGRQPPNPEPLNTDAIHELSFMCRSDFGKQYGQFSVQIVDISLLARQSSVVGSLSGVGRLDWILRLQAWFERMKAYLMSFGRNSNGIRLP